MTIELVEHEETPYKVIYKALMNESELGEVAYVDSPNDICLVVWSFPGVSSLIRKCVRESYTGPQLNLFDKASWYRGKAEDAYGPDSECWAIAFEKVAE